MELKNKTVLVAGTGISGIGATKLLLAVGAHVVLYDSNAELTKEEILGRFDTPVPQISVITGELSPEAMEGLHLAVLSPGVPVDAPFVKEMAERTEINAASHLTCPLRYINGKYKRGLDVSLFAKEIDEILAVLTERGIALEVNTSGIGTPFNDFMPDYEIVKRYYKMGGRLITIGSDAHISKNIANGFNNAAEMLESIGFLCYYYYRQGEPGEVPFK